MDTKQAKKFFCENVILHRCLLIPGITFASFGVIGVIGIYNGLYWGPPLIVVGLLEVFIVNLFFANGKEVLESAEKLLSEKSDEISESAKEISEKQMISKSKIVVRSHYLSSTGIKLRKVKDRCISQVGCVNAVVFDKKSGFVWISDYTVDFAEGQERSEEFYLSLDKLVSIECEETEYKENGATLKSFVCCIKTEDNTIELTFPVDYVVESIFEEMRAAHLNR